MNKFLSKFIFFVSLIFVFPLSLFAQVSKIVFTTDVQSIKPNELSEPITIQAQNSSGDAYQTPETIDLEFISSSATGEFLGSTGNPATTYMSKNTANRTFYYKDSREGNFVITIKAKGRDTGEEWSANQQITVSVSGLSSNNDSNSGGEVLGTSADNSSFKSQSSGGSTTNTSTPNSQLEVIAGTDRGISLGSPIQFQAVIKKNNTNAGLIFNWSFGDGNVGVGPIVNHTYKYSGEYVVVLDARAGNTFSVNRLKVKVLDSNLSVSEEGQYLEISNKGNSEVNLFNWKIENEGRGFIFQPNTIILPHTSIKLDKKLLTMKGLDNSFGLCLKNTLGEEVFAIAPTPKIDTKEVSQKIEDAKNEIAFIKSKTGVIDIKPEVSVSKSFEEKDPSNNTANVFQATGTENIIYESPREIGLVSKLTNFIKRVFSR